jgi:hypothetical protein
MTATEARRVVEAETTTRAQPRVDAMGREIGQSLYLMSLMAAMLTVYVGLGLLAVRLFG